MKITLVILFCNFSLFTLGIFKGSDLSDLGLGLAALNAPLIAWIIGETIRPTKSINQPIN